MSLELREGDFEAFFEAPFAAYGHASPYVSPLKSDLKRFLAPSNPLFSGASKLTYWTAHKNGRVLGRITAHIHHESNECHHELRGCFGYFDCVDDKEVAQALLQQAEDWCRAQGMTRIAGNFNLTAMQQIGVVTDFFQNEPYTDQIWSPPYLQTLLDKCGYQAVFPMTTFEVDLTAVAPLKPGPKHQAIMDDPAFSFVPITRKNIAARIEDAREILNSSFQKNPMFVPVSKTEFAFQAKDMKWILDPRISTMLTYQDKPAACVICIPDVNPFLRAIRSRLGWMLPWHFLKHRFFNKRAVVIFVGVMPDLQNLGVAPVMLRHMIRSLQKAGYEKMANTWIADENPASLAQAQKVGGVPLHRLHLFEKML